MEERAVPTFPEYIVVSVFCALLPITLVAAYRFRDGATRFLIAAIWLRYLMSAFHQYTFPPLVGGLSLNALASVLVTAIGFLIVDKRLLVLKGLGGIYLITAILLVSAVVSGSMRSVGSLAKWGYLLTLTIAAYEALRRHGPAALFQVLLTVFLAPLALQVLSILAGLGKVSEKDSSICFIGGYNHEAAFSIVILTLLYCACFLERDRPKLTILVMPVAVASLLLANYRTTLLAALPILAATMFFGTVRRFSPRDRPFIVIVVALVGATIFYAASIAMQERFSDLLVVLSNGTNLFKPPEYYTAADADLLSARAIIWSRYITAYLNGSITNLAIGFGPETWDELFTTYAHNSFVSVLYEAGIFGLVGLVLLFAWNFGFAARTAWDRRPLAMSAHIGFLVLNLATMPLWLIEGNVLLALTLAYTLHVQAPSTARTPQVRWNASAS